MSRDIECRKRMYSYSISESFYIATQLSITKYIFLNVKVISTPEFYM